MGTNHNATTLPKTFLIHGMKSDDNAINRAGGGLAIGGGPASGNGPNGPTSLGTFMPGASGFGYNPFQTNRLSLWGNYITLTTNSATTVCTFTIPTSLTCAGVKFSATTEIKDATDIASQYDSFAITALNKAGTVTTTNSVSVPSSFMATGSAGFTNTWTVTVSSTTVSIKCTCITSGINSTTARLVGARIELDSDSLSAVTFQ